MNWRELPCLRISLPFVLGILCYPKVFSSEDPIYTIICVSFFLFLFLEKFKISYRYLWIKGLFINCLLFLLGNHVAHIHNQYEWKDHFRHQLSSDEGFIIQVQQYDTLSESSKFIAALKAVQDEENNLISCKGLMSIHSKVVPETTNLKVGDLAFVKGIVKEYDEVKNPHAFDLKAFYAQKQLFHSMYLDSLTVLQKSNNSYIQQVQLLRTKLIGALEEHIPSQKENAVAKALLLGYKADLDEVTKSAYANTGALHILAVSGLHVGILCLILLSIFNLIKINKFWFKFFKLVFMLSCLYFYCCLTGSTASVMRASIMYGCLLVGNEAKRFSNIYNTIAGSAFIILWLDPFMINTVSFQLSYLALIGIIYFQPKLYSLWIPKNKILDFIWKLICVSMAAQLITFPISVYYFNQLPLLSWLSGIVAVPAAFAIFTLGIALFLVSIAIPILILPISKMLGLILWLNNQFIFCLQKIPHHKLVDLSFEKIDICILYLILVLIMWSLSFKKKFGVFVSLFVCLCFSIKLIYATLLLDNQSKIVIYHTPKASLIDFYSGREVYSMRSSTLSKKQEAYAAKACRLKHKSITQSLESFMKSHYSHEGLILFEGTSLFILNKKTKANIKFKMEVDILLIQENVEVDKEGILSEIKANLVVLDTSNERRYTKKWGMFLEDQAIPYHDVYNLGAYVK